MDKLQDTLLIFNKISIEMGHRTLAILNANSYDSKKINKLGPDLSVLTSLIDMNIIDACSFIDEYEHYFGVTTEEIYKNKILEIKRICKPIIAQIKKWKDLQTVRNSFIAHNLRSKDSKMVFRNEISYNAPRGVYEIELLNNCIQLIGCILDREFEVELEDAKATFQIRISKPNEFTKNDCWNIMNDLILIINDNLKKQNRGYQLNSS